MRSVLFSVLLVGVALGFAPNGAVAQDAEEAPPPGQVQTELFFEREVFAYPSFQRGNPFRGQVAADEGGPRFEQLRLMAVYMSEENPENSVAVIGTGNLVIEQDGTLSSNEGESFYVRAGQAIGNVTIVEIQRGSIVVDVAEFGLLDRRIMELPQSGGTQ